MKKLIIIAFIILSIVGCKADEETTPDDLIRVKIDLIHDRCVELEGEAEELDCFKEYAQALSTSLHGYIGVKIYSAD
ncbi:MAG: hypothetical protein HOD85_14415 [Deltaproteobacteria bacterium]|nr:hypothetical protein [Deltaproteobacteria bacterium]MBT4638740.1 hypothetical protein [Deltaproteobacteria bacterium]